MRSLMIKRVGMNILVMFLLITSFLQSFCNTIQVLSTEEFQELIENTHEKLVHVDEITDILDRNYFLVTDDDSHTYAIAPFDRVISTLQVLPQDQLQGYENYITMLHNGHYDVLLESTDSTEKRLVRRLEKNLKTKRFVQF